MGWLLSGPIPGTKFESTSTTAMLTVTRIDYPQDILKRFWDFDAIGVVDPPYSKQTVEEIEAMKQYDSNVSYEGGRYTVGLPWKNDHPPLVDNFDQALKRLKSVERSLKKDPKKAQVYQQAVKQLVDDDHARLIDEEDKRAEKIRYRRQSNDKMSNCL